MNHFRPIATLDTLAVVANLFKLKPHEWKGVPERGEVNAPEIGLGASLLLRGHKNITKENWLDDTQVEVLPALRDWKSMQALLSKARVEIMKDHDKLLDTGALKGPVLSGSLARAMVSRLDPGSTIFWHVDDGPYHQRTSRFHLPLVTNPGCFLHAEHEALHLEAGTLWYFNNHVRHCAANWGALRRYHLVFEMYRAEQED